MSRIELYRIEEVQFDNGREPDYGEFLIYIKDGLYEAVNFHCPCGCRRTCWTYLVNDRRPKNGSRHLWYFKQNGHLIDPSVHWQTGCRAHFYINLDGSVRWC